MMTTSFLRFPATVLAAFALIFTSACDQTSTEPVMDATVVSAIEGATSKSLAYSNPITKDQCKAGGWADFDFQNQGLCIRYVNTGQDSRDPLILRLDPLLWLDASSLDLADGASVALWPDLSNNANNAAPNTLANQPVFDSDGIAGMPVVTFDGSDDFLTTGDVTTENSTTVFAVTRATARTGEWADDWEYNHGVVNQYAGGSATSYISIEISSDAQAVQTWDGTWTGGVKDMTVGRITTVRRVHLTAVHIFVDGVELADGDATSYPGRTAPLRIGYTGDSSRYLDGDIAEIIIYNRALIPEEREAIEAYLMGKYGIGT